MTSEIINNFIASKGFKDKPNKVNRLRDRVKLFHDNGTIEVITHEEIKINIAK